MGTKLFVGNLAYRTTEDSLRELFEGDGFTLRDLRIVTDRETGRSRGFAFVEMESPDDARRAVESFDGVELDGRALRVDEARDRGNEPRRGGGGGGGGFGGGGRGRR